MLSHARGERLRRRCGTLSSEDDNVDMSANSVSQLTEPHSGGNSIESNLIYSQSGAKPSGRDGSMQLEATKSVLKGKG